MRYCLALCVVFGSLCCSADASLLSGLLTYDGSADSINDNSRALIFDCNDNDLLDTGDEIVGVLQFERVNDVVPWPAGLFSVFAMKVTGQRLLGGSQVILEHGAIASSQPHSLRSLLDPALIPPTANFNDWDNALFAFLEIDALASNDPKDPFSPTNSDPTDDPLGIIKNVLSAVNGYRLDAVVGFDQDNDFLSTLLNGGAVYLIGDGASPLLISEIRADNWGTEVLTERAGMSVLYHTLGNINFLSLAIKDFGNPTTTPTTYHDIIVSPVGSVQTSTPEVPNWDFEDDTNFRMNPVPEPGTAVLFASLAAILSMGRALRRP